MGRHDFRKPLYMEWPDETQAERDAKALSAALRPLNFTERLTLYKMIGALRGSGSSKPNETGLMLHVKNPGGFKTEVFK